MGLDLSSSLGRCRSHSNLLPRFVLRPFVPLRHPRLGGRRLVRETPKFVSIGKNDRMFRELDRLVLALLIAGVTAWVTVILTEKK